MKLIDLFEKTYNYRLGNASFVKVLENPSYTQMVGECNRILRPLYLNFIDVQNVDLRGLFNSEIFFMWYAWDATHEQVIKEMDLNKWMLTSFETGFTEEGKYFSYCILQNGGSKKDNKYHQYLMKAIDTSRDTMIAFRQENKDKLIE